MDSPLRRSLERASFVVVFTILAMIVLPSAFALDGNRALSQYVHRIWQAQQGLQQGTIYSILQTRDGYLWLGTQTGLIRFDGVRFTSLEEFHPGAPANVWIRNTIEDSHGALWIATNDSGVYRINEDKIEHYSTKEGLPSEIVGCLAVSHDASAWACTSDSLAHISGGKVTMYRQGLTPGTTRAVCEAGDGTIWAIGDAPEISFLDPSTGSAAFTSHRLTTLRSDANGRSLRCIGSDVWIGTTAGLVQFSKGHERLYTTKDGLPDNRVLCLSSGSDGSLWIGTRNGFSRLRNGEIDSFRPQEGLSQSTVYSLFEDNEGSLWVGTKNGLNQFLNGRAIPYTTNEGLPTNDTGPLIQDRQGTIWIGTLGSGLAYYNGRHFSTITAKQGLASNTIYSLLEDRAGQLWAGTSGGLNRLDKDRVQSVYTADSGLPSSSVRVVFLDHSGNLWAGTSKGPAVLRNGTFVVPPGVPRNLSISAIGEDHDSRLYFAAQQGPVFVYSQGGSHELVGANPPIRDVTAFYTDADGLIWMGTVANGLKLLDHGKVTTFFVRDGLFDNEIYGISSDEQGNLWMACSKGLFSVSRAALLQFAAGKIKKVESTPYSLTDALRTIECRSGVQPAVFRMRDGRLWFSTIRGLIVFDPAHLGHNVPPPPVTIEETTVNGKPEAPSRIASIAPGQKNLEFTYSGLSFIQPSRITFRYILEPFDKNWTDAGTRREAFYTNLPPGKYRFRVAACNSDGVCNSTGASVDFSLAPHFYQRPWFLPLCAVLAALAGWGVYQLRIRRLREQFNLILTERTRIARELHDTLIQGLSGITMEMQALSGRLRSPEERATLEDIIRDAGACLRETRRSVAGLRARGSGSGLAAAIAQAAQHITEAKPVRLKLKLEKNLTPLSPEVEYNMLRIASEAVNNSVKHSGAKVIEVALDSMRGAIRLSVKDDGSGFSREENGNVRVGHYGLIGMKERAAQIGAELNLATEPGRGTTVSVLLPATESVEVHQ